MIIDLHCHIAGIGGGDSACHVSPQLRSNWRYGIYLRAFGVGRETLEREGDAAAFRRLAAMLGESRHVAGAVILALDAVVGEDGGPDLGATEVCIPGEFVAREVGKYPGFFYGASVHPFRRDALARVERAVDEGAVLMKWLPAIQQIDPADPRHRGFYAKLRDLKLPLLVHTGGERSFTRSRGEYGDPQRLRLPLEIGVTVIAAHAATTGRSEGEDNMNRLLRLFSEFPNLYADISSLTQLNKLRYLPRLLRRREFHHRLLYGTDFPLIHTALVSPWYFPFRLSWRRMREIARIANPWDRDVELKLALGVPPEVFTRGAELLRLCPPVGKIEL